MAFLKDLRSDFAMKDILGDLSFFLGIEVKTTKDGIHLSQPKYALDILKIGMVDCKPCLTPILVWERLSRLDGDPLDSNSNTRYRSVVGALQYLTLTRPNLSFSFNKVCQYQHMILRVFTGQLWNGSYDMSRAQLELELRDKSVEFNFSECIFIRWLGK